jgi:hypothetical protein
MTSTNGTKTISEFNSQFAKKSKHKTVNHISDVSVGENVKVHIVKEFIEPMYINDVKNAIKEKKCWKITGQLFETMSKVLVAIGGIISFSSGYYGDPTLGFVAGAVSTVSLAMLQFSSFSYGENKKQSSELNLLLTKLDIDTIPEFNRDVYKNDDAKINDEINSLKMMVADLKDCNPSPSSDAQQHEHQETITSSDAPNDGNQIIV